jgi:cell fate (sporulation/competence/biofilm development) regulator YlbF (YheA/YmcA/DUF963 family)
MESTLENGLELAPPSVIRQAAGEVAAALVGQAVYQAFVKAADALDQDPEARRTLKAFQTRQQALAAGRPNPKLSRAEQADLEALRQAFMAVPAVAVYGAAESELKALCQAVADQLSQSLGIDFAGACRTGCC